MKIQRARLCLDCDELHEADRCPKCTSGAWCYPYEWLEHVAEKELDQRIRIAEEFMADLCN